MKRVSFVSALILGASGLTLAAVAPACGGSSPTGFQGGDGGSGNSSGGTSSGGTSSGGNSSGGNSSGGLIPPSADGGGPTTGTPSCPGGGTTSISGTVYDPAGNNPLYDVVVYVPGSTPSPLKDGASCDSCDSLYSGNPVATTLTGTDGKFTLKNVPAGNNVPLVIQIGKWRKQLKVATVASCQDNPQPDKSLKLPKNGSEGDIPQIAVSTGGADSLECLLKRVGLDESEYVGGGAGTGHIHIFEGGDATGSGAPSMSPAATSSASLWDSTADLMKYDIVLLSCEGQETTAMNQTSLDEYTKAGGRVFGSHFHYAWFNSAPFSNYNLASWTTGATPITSTAGGLLGPLGPSDGALDQTLPDGGVFPKGQALSQWLGTVGALTNNYLPIYQAKHNADVSASNVHSQTWIHAAPDTDTPNATEYFSFDTPVDAPLNDAGVPAYCGRVVFSDLHVGAGSLLPGSTGPTQDYTTGGRTVPTGCVSRALSPQEAALEFMLFDLSSCVTSDSLPPQPPPSNPPK